MTATGIVSTRPVRHERWLGRDVLSYPERPASTVDVLATAAERYADRAAFVADDGTATYAQFADLVEGAAARLRAAGLRPGDRVAAALRNSLALAVLAFACARGGFVMAGLSLRLGPGQWRYQLQHSGARLALTAPDLVDRVRDAAGGLGVRVATVGDVLARAAAPFDHTAPRPSEDDVHALVYTSGTTGRPKGSQVVHRCSVHSALTYVDLLDLRADDRTAVLFPLTYITGLHAHVLPAMHVGATSVLLADNAPSAYLDSLRRERVTWAYTVPALWRMLTRHDGLDDLPDLRIAAAGGSPFPDDLRAELRRRLPHVEWLDVYGLSETHSPACVLRHDEMPDHPGSVGRPLPCMEAKSVDDEGRTLPPDRAGELWLRGSLVTSGYHDDPEATSTALTADGWLRTGDVARIDVDGYVTIVDRIKDMIDRGGHKVYSAEVERVLRTHPAVGDAAVVGVPDRVGGQSVACVVELSGDAKPSARALRTLVATELADYAAPRTIRFVDALPRNPTGKVRKPELRAWLSGDAPQPRTEVHA